MPTCRQREWYGRQLLRIPNKRCWGKSLRTDLWDDPFLENSPPTFTDQGTGGRRSTRIPCDIPVTLVNRDPLHPFAESCQILLVNLNGCAVRSTRPVKVRTTVELQGLPTRTVTAQVVTCISLGASEKIWLLGIELHKPGNVWGIQHVPEDWVQ